MDTAQEFPFSYVVVKKKKIASANLDHQLSIAPWPTDVAKVYRIESIKISNFNGAAGALKIWDEDLTNGSSAPPARGSAGGELITIGFAGSGASGVSASETTQSVDQGSLAPELFQAGIAMQSTVLNVMVQAAIRVV